MANVFLKLALLPFVGWVLGILAKEEIAFRLRRRIGDASKRATCCAREAANFERGLSIQQLPQLASRLEHICDTNTGYI